MADSDKSNRPLSPHLTIYRPQMTSISSILVRITGNALIVPALLLVGWFVAAAMGPRAFGTVDGLLTCWPGDVVLTASVWGVWYHTLGGLRHLIWDTGVALDVATSEKMGWAMIGGSLALTVLTVVVI